MAKNVKSLNINNTEYTMRPYGTCGTVAATAAKVVTCTGFALATGATILVKFTYANTAANATLNVNTTGAKPIWYNAAGTATSTRWPAGSIVEFFYDGTYWQVLSMQLPFATSAINGLISTGTQTIAGAKTFSGNTSITGTLTVGTAAATKATTLNGQLSVVGNIVQTGGNLILDSNDKKTDSSGATTGYGATPRLVFRRGGTTDSYNDWDMWGNSEGNFFLRKGTSSTGAENTWKNIMVAKDAEVAFINTVKATTFVGALTGNASSASKLTNTSAIGSATQPVYFTSGGVPSACTYKLPVLSVNTILGVSDAGAAITTAQFIDFLKTKKVFDTGYAVYRGTWNYKSGHVITDTGCGNIHLAGATVEVIGVIGGYTIRIQTATTSSNNAAGVSGEVSRTFIYCYNGTDYSPGWYKLAKKGESLTASYSSGVLTLKV